MGNRGTLLLLLLLALTGSAWGQKTLSYKLSDWYLGTLDNVLDHISKQSNVQFEFDRQRLSTIQVDHHPIGQPLAEFLDVVVCRDNKLKYYINDAGKVMIVDRWVMINETKIDESSTYRGKPTRAKFSLTGRIIDNASVEPLPFASISVRGTTTGSNSNADGYFTLQRVPTDTVSLVVSAIGYKSKTLHLTPQTPLANLLVKLENENATIDEVVVTAEKQEVLQTNSKVGMIKMSPLKLLSLPSLGEKDIFRSFQLMPGISAANENSSGLYVRGGTPDQSLVVYDGFTVYNVEHLFGFFSSFNSNAIKDIQLYKGGFDAKYGGRISSVVEITGKEGNKKEFGGYADVSLMSANGFIEFPIGEKFTVIAAGRRSWQSPLYDKIFNKYSNTSSASGATDPNGRSPFGTSDLKSYFYDFNTKLTYRPTDRDIIWLSYYSGNDDLTNDISSGFKGSHPMGGGGGGISNFSMSNTDNSNWGNHGVSLKWSRKWNEKFYGNFLIGYSNYYSNRDKTSSGSYVDSAKVTQRIKRGVMEYNHLDDYSVKADFEQKVNATNVLEYGINSTFNNITYSYAQSDTMKLIDRKNQGLLLSTYLQDKISMYNGLLKITPGLRSNFYSVDSKMYFEPRLTASYELNDRWKIKGSTGRYYQFAKRVVREDVMSGNKDFWTLSDGVNIPVTYSDQLIAGVSWENNGYLIDVEAYYKRITNLTEYSLRFSKSLATGSFNPGRGMDQGAVTYQDQFLTGTGRVQGIDILLQKKQGDLTGWIGYTLGRVVNHINGYGNYDYYASNDVTHEFKAVATYHWRSWDFSGTWIYASGKPYTAPEGGYTVTLLDGTKKSFVTVSTKNGKRLPDYHRLDLSATLNMKLGGRIPATIGFSVFNAYNRSNVWYKQFEIVDNTIVETNINYLGITPNINFTIKF